MARRNAEVEAARALLLQARDRLRKLLWTDPAWLALEQLDARARRAGGLRSADEETLRQRLVRQLDVTVPDWHALARVELALAALDEPLDVVPVSGAGTALAPPRSLVPPPLAAASLAPPARPREPSAIAIPNSSDAVALDVEAEPLPRPGETGRKASHITPAIGSRARPAQSVDLIHGLAESVEEAEVEIVLFDTEDDRPDASAIFPAEGTPSREASPPAGARPVVSSQPYLDEATVEIVIIDETTGLPKVTDGR